MFKQKFSQIAVLTCIILLTLPISSQAASDEDIAAMRLQLEAMSKRLDSLEADNRALVETNAELRNSVQAASARVVQASDQATPSTNSNSAAATANDKDTPPAVSKESSWADRISWQGDFRYRYENIAVAGDNRNRNRIRARPALIANVAPDVEVGFGLATGGDDPVSSNQTLGGGGSSKGIALDLAYFDWKAANGTNIIAGKFKNDLYKAGGNSMLWDSDWRPEGTNIIWKNDLFFANALGTWIESDSAKGQSFAYGLQGGVTFPIGDAVSVTAGAGYYVFDVKGRKSIYGGDDDFYGNSFNPITQTYLYNYEEIEVFANMKFDLFSRPLVFFGDYVQNQAVKDNDIGYALGFSYGKASNKGQWEIGYTYEKLEADAAFGLLTNSDFGIGGTNTKGSIIDASYALRKGINAAFSYYITDVGIRHDNPVDVNRLQLDLLFKYK